MPQEGYYSSDSDDSEDEVMVVSQATYSAGESGGHKSSEASSENELKQLRENLTRVSQEKGTLTAKHDKLKAEYNNLLKDFEARMKLDKSKISEMKREIETLQAENMTEEELIRRFSDIVPDNSVSDIEKMKEYVQKLLSENINLNKLFNEGNKSSEEETEKTKALAVRIEELKKSEAEQNDYYCCKLDELVSQKSDAEKKISEKDEEICDLRKSLEKLSQSSESSNLDEVTDLKNEMLKIREHSNKFKAENEDLKAYQKILESESINNLKMIEELSKSVKSLEESLSACKKQIKSKEEILQEILGNVSSLEAQLKEAEADKEKLILKLSSGEDEIMESESSIKTLKALVKELEHKVKDSEQKMKLQKEMNEGDSDEATLAALRNLDATETLLAQVKEELRQAHSENLDLEKQLDAERSRLKEAEKHVDEIHLLKEQLNEAEERISKKDDECSKLQQMKERTEADLRKQRHEIENSKISIESLNTKLRTKENLADQVKQLKSQLEQIQSSRGSTQQSTQPLPSQKCSKLRSFLSNLDDGRANPIESESIATPTVVLKASEQEKEETGVLNNKLEMFRRENIELTEALSKIKIVKNDKLDEIQQENQDLRSTLEYVVEENEKLKIEMHTLRTTYEEKISDLNDTHDVVMEKLYDAMAAENNERRQHKEILLGGLK